MFGAAPGAVVGPVQSDFGWVVAKVNSAKSVSGKTLDQARAEIAAKLNADKRKGGVEDLVDKVQNAVDGGSNFAEAAAAAKLPVTNTPLITANGSSRTDPSYKLPPELAPALKSEFANRAERSAGGCDFSRGCGLCARFPRRGGAGRSSAARLHP